MAPPIAALMLATTSACASNGREGGSSCWVLHDHAATHDCPQPPSQHPPAPAAAAAPPRVQRQTRAPAAEAALPAGWRRSRRRAAPNRTPELQARDRECAGGWAGGRATPQPSLRGARAATAVVGSCCTSPTLTRVPLPHHLCHQGHQVVSVSGPRGRQRAPRLQRRLAGLHLLQPRPRLVVCARAWWGGPRPPRAPVGPA